MPKPPERMHAYQNPKHPGNGPAYLTGLDCIEGCGRPGGTQWSPLWCFECNKERMDRISASLQRISDEARRAPEPLEERCPDCSSTARGIYKKPGGLVVCKASKHNKWHDAPPQPAPGGFEEALAHLTIEGIVDGIAQPKQIADLRAAHAAAVEEAQHRNDALWCRLYDILTGGKVPPEDFTDLRDRDLLEAARNCAAAIEAGRREMARNPKRGTR